MDKLEDDNEIEVFKPPKGTAHKPTTSTPWLRSSTKKRTISFDDSGYLSYTSQSDRTADLSDCDKNISMVYPQSTSGTAWLLSDHFSEIGSTHVDFLEELGGKWRHCMHILSKLFQFLSSEDLCAMCCVSKSWKRICSSDIQANKRRLKYIQSKTHFYNSASYIENRENLPCSSAKSLNKKSELSHRTERKPGNSIENVLTIPQKIVDLLPHQTTNNRHDIFIHEASKLKRTNEALLPCPRCTFPAVVDNRIFKGSCSRASCKFVFCTKCMCDICDPKTCLWRSRRNEPKKKNVVGSKQSKRNLKRL